MADISPQLIDEIKSQFNALLQDDKQLKGLEEILKSGQSTYEDADHYAERIGELMGGAMQKTLSGDVLPDGKMYYNIADKVLNQTMADSHKVASDFVSETQTALNHRANLNMKGVKVPIHQDRIDGMVQHLADAESFDDTVAEWLRVAQVTYHKAIVTDSVKHNAEMHYEAGLNPKIKRRWFGGCDWCRALAGTYDYPDGVPDDVYRRHGNCHCIVEYFPGNGRRQDVHTKKWKERHTDEVNERIKKSQEPIGKKM